MLKQPYGHCAAANKLCTVRMTADGKKVKLVDCVAFRRLGVMPSRTSLGSSTAMGTLSTCLALGVI